MNAARREVVSIVRQEGALALWRGNSATLIRIFPYAGIQYAAFDHYQRMILRTKENTAKALGPFDRLCAGSLAGDIF